MTVHAAVGHKGINESAPLITQTPSTLSATVWSCFKIAVAEFPSVPLALLYHRILFEPNTPEQSISSIRIVPCYPWNSYSAKRSGQYLWMAKHTELYSSIDINNCQMV